MFGFRPDGKRVKDLDPIQLIVPHIMPSRHDSQLHIRYECPCEPFDNFIRDQHEKGEQYDYMHIVIASMVRMFAKFPRTNRFVMNGRIYKRNRIQVSIIVKKDLQTEAADSSIKMTFTGLESIKELRDKVDATIAANTGIDQVNGTDKLARLLTYTPNFVLKFLMWTIKFLDKHGLLPGAIIDLSPFHTSGFITNLKSIKGPSLYHHLYDFGNVGFFVSMGKEAIVPVYEKGEIKPGKRISLLFVIDERYCDGFYYVKATNYMRLLLKHPEHLLEPLEALEEDTKVLYGKKAAKQAGKE